MNVLIDARVGQYPNIGSGVYINSLAYALERIVSPSDNINLLLYKGKKLHPVIEKCKNVNLRFSEFGLEWSTRKELKDTMQINRLIQKYSIDIFHSPLFLKSRDVSCKQIVTIMDLYMFGPWHGFSFPKKLWWQFLMRRSVKIADGIIAISDYTRNLIHERFDISLKSTRTIYLGPGYIGNEIPLVCDTHIKDTGKYILFVGSPKPNKNLTCLIEAFSGIDESLSRELELLLVAPKPVWADELLDTTKISSRNRIRWMEAVSDAQIRSVYEKAHLFVHPSFVEGFGLPLVEAMACGLPIVASDIPINNEIAGGAAIYFDPHSSNELRYRIEEVLTDSELRNSLRERSLERARRYSWDVCAKQHYAAYKEVLEG